MRLTIIFLVALASGIGTTATAYSVGNMDEHVIDNELICGDQFLSLVQGIGPDDSAASAEFRVLMSTRCSKKAREGLRFGKSEAPPLTPADSEHAIDLLTKTYKGSSDSEVRRKAAMLIKTLRGTPPTEEKLTELQTSTGEH